MDTGKKRTNIVFPFNEKMILFALLIIIGTPNPGFGSDYQKIIINDTDVNLLYLDRRLDISGKRMTADINGTPIRTCKPIKLDPGKYCISGCLAFQPPRGCFSETGDIDDHWKIQKIIPLEFILVEGGYFFEIKKPGFLFVDVRLSKDLTRIQSFIQIENAESLNHKNKINPDKILPHYKYSIKSNELSRADDHELVAVTELIPVAEGKFYTYSSTEKNDSVAGGYFGNGAERKVGQSAICPIHFIQPVAGTGLCFQVPAGREIKYVLLNIMMKSDMKEAKFGNQLEEGEVASPYKTYDASILFKGESSENTIKRRNTILRYTDLSDLRYYNIADKIPNFRKHWYAKDKDLTIINTGTSLTARSTEYCTRRKDASSRPPLMHSNNLVSYLWDALMWEGQVYRRYDYPGFFVEDGHFRTVSGMEEWDDYTYRDSLTRYSDEKSSSIRFAVPQNAWQFNFIYRTDINGSEDCKITIAEGNGKMEVFNGTGWVEANNYIFSMKESAPVNVSVIIVDPNSKAGNLRKITDYQVKGNSVYQKRLKMRCKSESFDSLGVIKHIKITHTSGRFMYWGVEFSPREFMITFINAARGSHNSLLGNNSRELSRYQDSDIHIHKPDLFLSEDPIHNAGASDVRTFHMKNSFMFAKVTENFFFADNGISLLSRAKKHWSYVPEFVLFNTTITSRTYGGLDSDGNCLLKKTKDGKVWSSYDAMSSVYMGIKEKYPDVVYINATKFWIEACINCFGSIGSAVADSSPEGYTFICGSHWNDIGCKVMARIILPVIFDL
ncbi:MAG: hypothetical protein E7055_12590 [Lentisphaerae bacterium]|nr:hypothetical protein [Lentisphaerota bacterium]